MASPISLQTARVAVAAMGLLWSVSACDRPAVLKNSEQENPPAPAVLEAPEGPQEAGEAILLKLSGGVVTAGSEGNTASAEAMPGAQFTWVVNGGVITGGEREPLMTYKVDEDATSVQVLCRTMDAVGKEQMTTGVQAVVPPPVLEVFETKPGVITAGSSGTLRWIAREIKSLTLDPGGQDVTAEGSIVVKPSETTAYTLTARNLAGSSVRRETTLKVVAAPEIRSLNSEAGGQVGRTISIQATFANGRAELWNGSALIGSSVDSPWVCPVTLKAGLSLTFKVTNEAGAWVSQTLSFQQGGK